MGDLEAQLRGLLRGEHSHLSVSFNGHSSNYCTVAEAIENGLYDWTDWASDDERERAIEMNRVWTVQWYPNTPVGFCAVAASSLGAALEAALSGRH